MTVGISGWPRGKATLTLRWDDGTELVVNRITVTPDDLGLSLEEPPLPDFMCHPVLMMPQRITRGRVTLDAEMVPDHEDCFYIFRQGT